MTHESNQSKTKWLSRIWKKRTIYAPVLIHVYDTVTDIGVILIWADLAFKEKKKFN